MGNTKGKRPAAGRPMSVGRRFGRSIWYVWCLALLAGAVAWTLVPRDAATGQADQFRGGARLAVDKDLIDFGAVRYNQFVEARFQLKNVGDQPLQLPASPPVEVVEGC
jgi:hypothetical protein